MQCGCAVTPLAVSVSVPPSILSDFWPSDLNMAGNGPIYMCFVLWAFFALTPESLMGYAFQIQLDRPYVLSPLSFSHTNLCLTLIKLCPAGLSTHVIWWNYNKLQSTVWLFCHLSVHVQSNLMKKTHKENVFLFAMIVILPMISANMHIHWFS